ncbi:MAG TPA: hypothetical protein DHV35_08515 [Halieaceae bacterium]|nr:hypothetical protein [Halieaceae bacterium]
MKPLATAVLGLAMRVVATTSIIMTPKMALSDVSFEAVPKVAIIRLVTMKMPETRSCTDVSFVKSGDSDAESVSAKSTEPMTSR